MKVCMRCNENYDDEFVFCPKCGSNLIKDNHVKCPKCGKLLEKDYVFCPYCGNAINNKDADVANESLETGKNYYYGKGVEKDFSKAAEIFNRFAEQGDLEAQTLLGFLFETGEGVERDSEKAAEWYEKAAKQGYACAQFNLGLMYDNGVGVDQDSEKAMDWYERAAEQGHEGAQYNLGCMYDNGEGVEQDSEKAAEWFRKAAEQGHIDAQFNLGCMYDKGEGVEQDSVEATEWFRKAAEQGHIDAQFNMGARYEKGNGVQQDLSKAAEWYEKAAEQGDVVAQFNLGHMYYVGEGVEQDYDTAAEWYEQAVEQGHAGAQNNLGIMYYNGEGVDQDYVKAAELLKDAAEQGNARAQFKLGKMYQRGEGVEQDYVKAAELYEKAAKQGHYDAHVLLMNITNNQIDVLKKNAESGDAISQIKLGDKYADGQGIERDYKEAFKWYLMAAEQGNSYGQYCVGNMFEEGKGVGQDYKEAFNWYLKAAGQNNDDAQYSLGEFYYAGKGIDVNKYEAFEWYKKAADNGNIIAELDLEEYFDITEDSDETKINDVRAGLLLELGNKYFNGIDADKDLQKATAYYQRAAALGNEEAKTLLKKLDNYNIETKTGKENSEQSDTDDSTQENKLSNPDDELELGIAFFKNKNFSKAYEHLKISDKSGDREAYIWLLQDIVTNIKKNDVRLVKKDITAINLNLDSVLTKCKDFKFKDTFKQMCNVADYLKSNIMYSDYKYKSSDKGIANDMIQQVIVRLYECAGKYGDADSLHRVGLLYENGDGVEKNYELARACYEKSASQGNLDSIYRLGNFYHYGKAMAKKDLAKAREFYQKAVDQGLVKAFTGLAIMYFTGEGVERDYEKAFELFSKAVDTENPESEALYLLGFMYENEFGVQRDYDKAKAYYQQALKGSYSRAADGLKRVEEKLKRAGVNTNKENKKEETQNPAKTPNDEVIRKKTELEVCIERANKGDMNSILRLGDMYYFGNGNEKDHIKAAYWYRTAAEKGDANAQFNLAAMYQSGDGVPQNEETAKEWYQKAAENGHEEAKIALLNLNNDEEEFLLPEEDEVDLLEGEEDNTVKAKTDEDLMIQYELASQYESNAFIGPLLAAANFDDRFTMSWKELRSRIKGMKLINPARCKQVVEVDKVKNIGLNEEWTIWNSNFLEVVDTLTNHKLSALDIFELQDFLDEILRGHLMEIAISVEKQDAGRMLVGLMDTMGTTSHLTMEEKRWLACAIIVMTYVGSYDEKTGQFLLGIFEFTSVEEFCSKYNCGYGSYFFDSADNFPKYDQRQPFGYSIQNPITAPTVMTSAIYLKSLRSKDGEVSIRRLGTVGGTFGELLDKYEVTVTKKHFFSKDEKTVNYLYINEFGLEFSFRPPEGFYLEGH